MCSISMRLKYLEKYGHVKILGRTKKFTEVGNLIVEINNHEGEFLK
jgi:hypothetical protein